MNLVFATYFSCQDSADGNPLPIWIIFQLQIWLLLRVAVIETFSCILRDLRRVN